MTDGLTASDVALIQGNGRNSNGGFGDGEGWWVIILFALIFGWGRGGNGGFGGYGGGGSDSGAAANYVLASDFATLQRQLSDGFNAIERRTDGIVNGICDLGYTQQSLINNTNMNLMQGFNATQAQLAQCCCDIREGVAGVNYNNSINTNNIQRQISDCCCDVERQIERGFADTNYHMANDNCATLQAIDKVGDRIIDYLANDKMQTLRDENFALRLSASQERQNNYLISRLDPNPCPVSAYVVQPPQTVSFPVGCNGYANYAQNNGCGCNGGYNVN